MDKKTLLVSVSLWAAAMGSVKAEDVRLDVSQAGFSAALVEQLVDEYNRQSADGTRIVLTKGDGQSADGRVVLQEKDGESIGRFVVLPIANVKNAFLAHKYGITCETCSYKAQINGTACHVTAMFGFALAGLVINDIVAVV